jgi:hypothetical protein
MAIPSIICLDNGSSMGSATARADNRDDQKARHQAMPISVDFDSK